MPHFIEVCLCTALVHYQRSKKLDKYLDYVTELERKMAGFNIWNHLASSKILHD